MALNGLFSPLSLKEPDTCVHPKEVCSSSAVLQGQSLPCTGQRQAMRPQLRLMALLKLHFHLIFYFIFFFVWGQHLAALCTILLPSLKSTVQPGAVPLANVPGPEHPGPEHPPPVPAWTSPCPGTVPLAFGAGSSKPILLLMHEAADDGDDLIRASGLFLCRWHRYQRSQLCWWCRQ